jgi:hypothetical protein
MANIQVGKYLYNTIELPFTAKVLNVLNKRTAGASMVTIADQPEIKADFNGDAGRTQSKVKVALSNLRFRNVIQEVQKDKGITYFKIMNKDEVLTLIAEGAKIVEGMAARTVQAADDVKEVSNSKNEKVKKMATKNVKAPRMFLNPETNAVEVFGIGRPSKVKLAFECDAAGKLLNPEAASAMTANGGKSDDKLTKAELVKIVAELRGQVRELTEQRDQLAEIVGGLTADENDSDNTEVSADDADVSDDDDDLDLEAEAVDSDDDSLEVEATDAE